MPHKRPGGWLWQRDFVNWIHESPRTVTLKARQLGITWLSCGYVLWTALYKRGSLCLVYRQKEEEAQENLQRIWHLMNSLPKNLWNGAVIDKPQRGSIPTEEIRIIFPDGTVSRILAMTSSSTSGHGKTAAVVLLDEFSRIERASEIWKAVQPAAGAEGKVIVVSTANGVSNPETGEGNHFHWLWANADDLGYSKLFLPWSRHPDRDDFWYEYGPEIRPLKTHERAEQFPSNEHEAFTLTNRSFFNPDDLAFYRKRVVEPFFRADFKKKEYGKAILYKSPRGMISFYEFPQEESKYAISADVATGRGLDFSAAHVIDLGTMEFVAEFRGKLDADLFAEQLHFLGRFYNDARIAIEMGGGYGEPVIIALRDGKEGRPPYPRLYRHRQDDRTERVLHKNYGYPINSKTRPLVINQLEKAIRERLIPFLTDHLVNECYTFVYHNNLPSPRAAEGCHDDCVMSAAIALELYRMYGDHPNRYTIDRVRLEPDENVKARRQWFNKRYLKEPITA